MAPELFRSGWFVESLLTQLLTIFIVRTYKPFYRSRPSKLLMFSALGIGLVAIALPYSPVAHALGLVPLPLHILAAVLRICWRPSVSNVFFIVANVWLDPCRRHDPEGSALVTFQREI